MLTETTTPAAKTPSVRLVRLVRSYMDATPRILSAAAQERHSKKYGKMEAACAAAGWDSSDVNRSATPANPTRPKEPSP